MLLESFCVVSSLWHIVVALCLNVGSLCDHWRGGSSHCSSVCVDSTSPWTLSFCLSGGGEFCSANQPCNPPQHPYWADWTPPPPPRKGSVAERLIDGCHSAEVRLEKEKGVALWHMPSIHHGRAAAGIKKEEGGSVEMRRDGGVAVQSGCRMGFYGVD